MSMSDLQRMPPPTHLYLHLVDVHFRPLHIAVKVGDSVAQHQMLAYNDDTYIHAPYDGMIQAIEDHPVIHHQAHRVPTLVLTLASIPDHSPPQCLHHGFIDTVLKQGIIGMGGAGFSTARKCAPNIHSILVNAMECEPQIKADEAMILHYPHKVIAGIRLIQTQYPHADLYFCTENTKTKVLHTITPLLPSTVKLYALPSAYPSGAERTLIHSVLGLTLPVGSPASTQGILCINVSTVAAIADAHEGIPLCFRIMTLVDEIRGISQDIEIPVGTRVTDVLAYAGIDPQDTVISQGGSYMPIPVHDIQAPLTKTSNCLLIRPALEKEIMPCIRCSACVPVCPEQLLPQQLYWHLMGDDIEGAAQWKLNACINCGACDAVCPSNIPLAAMFAYGKDAIKTAQQLQTDRTLSEARYTARASRTARLQEIREYKRSLKRETLNIDDKKAVIQAALDRVNARQRKPTQ